MKLTRANCYRRSMPSAVAVLSLLISIVPRPAHAGDVDPATFELDGNAVDDSGAASPDDWATLYNGGGVPGGSALKFTFTPDAAVPDGIFTSGGSKDVNDVTQWRRTTRSAPDKDDITDAYAAAYVPSTGDHAGHLLVVFGADRFDNSGDAQIGFWFFQDKVGPDARSGFTGKHKDGDVLVVSNFVNGGSSSNIEVYKWVGGSLVQIGSGVSAGTRVCNNASGSIPANSACAVTNSTDHTTAPWPYSSKDGTHDFPHVTFFEGAIDMNAFGLGGECISTFLAETRSSQSSTAVLKDYALGSFDTCGMNVTSECGTASLAGSGDSVTYNFDGTVCNIGFGSLTGVSVTSSPSASITQSGTTLAAHGSANDCISYGGTYTAASLSQTFTVTASASTGAGTISDTAQDITCAFDLTPTLSVSKQCDFDVVNDVLKVNFGGSVCNTGTEKVTNVQVFENGTPITPSSGTLSPKGQQGDCASYTGTPFSPGASSTDPSTISSTDTVTAVGQGVLSGKTANAGPTSATCYLCN